MPLLILIGSQASADNRVYEVQEVIALQEVLIGQRVLIRGTMPVCQPLSCYVEGTDRNGDNRFLSIGYGGSFTRDFVSFEPRQVEISAVVTDHCMPSADDEIIVACTDRPNTLSHTHLIRFLD